MRARAWRPTARDIVALLDRPVIRDPRFRAAVKAIHAGNVAVVMPAARSPIRNSCASARSSPIAIRKDYFRDPKLFWFIANNPKLMRKVPANIADIGRAMIERGVEKADLDYTLELVMSSGSVAQAGRPSSITLLAIPGRCECHIAGDPCCRLRIWK